MQYAFLVDFTGIVSDCRRMETVFIINNKIFLKKNYKK